MIYLYLFMTFANSKILASLGLVAYPGQGIKRSIRSSFRNKRQKQIVKALHVDGVGILREERQRGMRDAVVLDAFARLIRTDDIYDSDDYM